MKGKAAIIISFILFSPFLTINGNENGISIKSIGNVLYVGGNSPNNYTTIQAAINDAENGYIIYVYPHQYNESIVINKSISLIGIVENGNKPIIHGIGNKSALIINADECTLKNFILKSKEKEIAPDISPSCIIYSNRNTIENNTFMYGWCSLYLYGACSNVIKNNVITKGYFHGVRLRKGSHNRLLYNSVISNLGEGIKDSDNNDTILYNQANKNGHGIELWYASNCTLAYNHAYKNYGDGINMVGCKNVVVKNNSLHGNAVAGIQMMGCYHCIVERNKIYRNQGGIMVQSGYTWQKQYNTIRRNNISFNKDVGIYVERSLMNTFEENNLIKNKINAWVWYEFMLWIHNKITIILRPCHNTWRSNYWGNWNLKAPKPIRGILDIDISVFDRDIFYVDNIPCYNFDFHPAMEPYKI